jgi:hypothetical protein
MFDALLDGTSGPAPRLPLASALGLAWALAACSGTDSPADSNAAGTGASGGSAGASATGGVGASAGAATGGRGGSGTAGSGGSSGGAGGVSGTGASSGSGASAGKGAGAAGESAGQSGSGGAGALGGAPPMGGRGGTSDGGRGGMGGGAGGAAGTGNTTGCTRDLLKSTIDAFFTALAAHDPATLPLADPVKFTENGDVLEPGASGLWTTAGAVKYTQSALDTTVCTSATQAVVPDGNTDIPIALRLKLVDQKLTEMELIAVRQGDYSVASNTGALAALDDTVHWEDPVEAGERNSRDELVAWMDKYFREFPSGVCNTTSNCKRLENGGGNYSCSAGASCVNGAPMGNPMLDPRLILGDEETGIGVGFTLFQGMYADMHMFKMYGDQVHAVSATLSSATKSGW